MNVNDLLPIFCGLFSVWGTVFSIWDIYGGGEVPPATLPKAVVGVAGFLAVAVLGFAQAYDTWGEPMALTTGRWHGGAHRWSYCFMGVAGGLMFLSLIPRAFIAYARFRRVGSKCPG